jgi:hypothetical protein
VIGDRIFLPLSFTWAEHPLLLFSVCKQSDTPLLDDIQHQWGISNLQTPVVDLFNALATNVLGDM